MDTVTLEGARRRAVRFLAETAARDGSWTDFPRLPVGASDGWVTAYVGFALTTALDVPGAEALAHRAAAWLQKRRGVVPAWGYNDGTGPDADSTAFAVLLLRACGFSVPDETAAWLEAHCNPDGGVATYRRDDGWGRSHACVTPTVLRALDALGRAKPLAPALAYLARVREGDGAWPSYFWRCSAYAEWCVRSLVDEQADVVAASPFAAALGPRRFVPRGPGQSPPELAFRSALELACWVGVAALEGARPAHLAVLAGALCSVQLPDGSFPPSQELRVTDPSCLDGPEAHGPCFADERRAFGTATALAVLSSVRSRGSTESTP